MGDMSSNCRLWLSLADGELREYQDIQPDKSDVCGYIQNSNGSKRHYVMFDLNLNPFNPMAKHDIETNARLARMRGNIDPYRFIEVTQAKFEIYQKFLKTRNVQFLNGVR